MPLFRDSLAQFNSELLEISVSKNADPNNFVVDENEIDKIVEVEIEGFEFIDLEDAYRLDYVKRKMPRPYNLWHFMTEGQTEDFIGAWESIDEDNKEIYSAGNPADWETIFDIP